MKNFCPADLGRAKAPFASQKVGCFSFFNAWVEFKSLLFITGTTESTEEKTCCFSNRIALGPWTPRPLFFNRPLRLTKQDQNG